MNRIYLYVIALLLVTTSCGEFLEEESQNLSYVHSTQDLDELLIGNGYLQKNKTGDPYRFLWLDVMDDDVTHFLAKAPSDVVAAMFNHMRYFYRWDAYPFNDDSPNMWAGPSGWDKLYSCIGMVNVILAELDRFKDEKEHDRIMGEAYFLRAFYYFYLVNLWGHPYNTVSASTDLGVPIKLTEYIEDKGYSRNSVEECYQQIVSDAKEAVVYLEGVTQPSTRRANQNAARALLAKTYLYMNEYELALEQCNAILEKPGDLVLYNLNAMTPSAFQTAYRKQVSNECIFTNSYCSLLFQTTYESVAVSTDLINCYDDPNDLRFVSGGNSHFFRYYLGNYFGMVKAGTGETYSISLVFSEVYLNKAEALAMLGRTDEAIETLQKLRENRMTDAGTINLTGEDLVKFIRAERRRDLCFMGQRWFDLKRYAVHPKYPQKTRIEHPYYTWTGSSAILEKTYVLEEYPGDGGWLMPFPSSALISNEGALKNNVRPDR
ncbi:MULTISPECIES: RagB/SusD family nutrient uptake outer membrane protein [unclassified Butyricimonas]|uniref:RagB/SusD family nutrient uptake outer membrane protein n=1 Tax=unclassified Butyricimonas TaxID=2637652 RepID=UPI00159BD725|nr:MULTISPECIES: RagB/SusD family nutrient uptake outer membrane protein [unclassified Butyricimonas]